MAYTQSQLTSAFVLHTRPYRETSMLVDFFTREFGRITGIVRGVRKARSLKAGLLSPFLPLCLSFRGKTDLLNVVTLETNGAGHLLQGHALFCGLYANELLYWLLQRHDPYSVLYTNYQALLHDLVDISLKRKQLQLVLYLFIKKLLQEIGYGLQWNRTSTGDDIIADKYYRFEFGIGFNMLETEWGQQGGVALPSSCCYKPIQGKYLLAMHDNSFVDLYRLRTCFQSTAMVQIDSNSLILQRGASSSNQNPHSADMRGEQNSEWVEDIGHVFNVIFHHLLGDKFLLCQRIFLS